jgi:hypothetical protein
VSGKEAAVTSPAPPEMIVNVSPLCGRGSGYAITAPVTLRYVPHVSPTALDDLLELAAGWMGRCEAHQAVELGVELVGIAAQCGVGELRAPFADGAGALEQFAQAGREGAVAGIDGVLGVANEVGEADLIQ